MPHQLNEQLIIYQSKNGAIELKADSEKETVWLSQDQIAQLFGVQKAAISKHLKNIFDSEELAENSVVSILETTAQDGKKYQVRYFNLDAVLSIGYRVNSKQATHFRQWANKILKSYIIDGYSLNKNRLKIHADQFLQAVEDVKKLLSTNSILLMVML
jgi:hypothetical protein